MDVLEQLLAVEAVKGALGGTKCGKHLRRIIGAPDVTFERWRIFRHDPLRAAIRI